MDMVGGVYAVVPPEERWGECRERIAELTTFILLLFHHRTIINTPFTCLLEEGYLISYSARRESLLVIV